MKDKFWTEGQSGIEPEVEQAWRPKDPRDRMILALCALLKAERDTRQSIELVLESGEAGVEALRAMVLDPVPVVPAEDLAAAERLYRNVCHLSGGTNHGA